MMDDSDGEQWQEERREREMLLRVFTPNGTAAGPDYNLHPALAITKQRKA